MAARRSRARLDFFVSLPRAVLRYRNNGVEHHVDDGGRLDLVNDVERSFPLVETDAHGDRSPVGTTAGRLRGSNGSSRAEGG
jgi:hypothetical protein